MSRGLQVDALVTVALASEGATEHPPNSNAGPYVERVLKRTGLGKGYPWCAAWIADLGAIAFGADWPLPLTASCAELGRAAEQAEVLNEKPARGDVFLIWFEKLGRYAHTGLVLEVHADGRCTTLEGNTNDGGSREGWGVFRRTRQFAAKDRFIRWGAM
ncbi:MAG: CHAP domain-containing protein [Gemmatimonadaceae bacterium]|nr:CHAP domain-containing protein [Gemmatimonadaceae bacterium]